MKTITYIRVSTKFQGELGLGLEGQQMVLGDYARRVGGTIIAEYREVETVAISWRDSADR